MNRHLALLAVLVAVVGGLCAPYGLWRNAPARELDVVIVDNTVPDSSYREHRGLVWLLNHEKYRSAVHGEYDVARDYYGFFPQPGRRYGTRALPERIAADLIYIADTYGVYQTEWLGENPQGERSPRVYGGMAPAEWRKLERAVHEGTPLVAEFNSFASPTGRATRERMYDLLHLEWSGWIGRYFNDLSENVEVPSWAVAAYERQYREPWTFTGEGFILVDEHDTIIVLRPGRDFSGGECATVFSAEWAERLGVRSGVRYRYWFDIVMPREGARELAHFALDLTDDGKAQLAKFDVPTTFPAVVHYGAGPYWSYYFAGDFVDTGSSPRFHQVNGYDRLKAWLTPDRPEYENQAFYWQVYVPMVQSILRAAYERAQAE
jgi:hypothetical protein